MRKRATTLVSLLLAICILFQLTSCGSSSSGTITEQVSQAANDTSGWVSQAAEDASGWVGQAAEDTSGWVSQAAEDTSEWVSQAAEDTSEWVSQATEDTAGWISQAKDDISAWTMQAWGDSSGWVKKAWHDSTSWTVSNWNNFLVWVDTVVTGNPYSWIEESVLNYGIPAYDSYSEIRSFLYESPTNDQINDRFFEELSKLSLINEDKAKIMTLLQDWSNESNLQTSQTQVLALPFLARLSIEGETAIGEEIIFSGPVIAQYLITVLEDLDLKSSGKADQKIKMLNSALDKLTRPVIIGDVEQNVLVTDDHICIENFSFADGKYQVILIASNEVPTSEYPSIRGKTLEQQVRLYFEKIEQFSYTEIQKIAGADYQQCASFTTTISSTEIEGRAIAVWYGEIVFLAFVITDQEWNEDEFTSWVDSISLHDSNAISLSVDFESDGSFYGVNQVSQKYTINRIYDETRFLVPKTGHGWAAERGNNLIDNLKGLFKGSHATIVGDNNVENGPDRLITNADGSKLFVQSKYYSNAVRGIDACFENGHFRYFDAEGNPMAIEVPSDQYETAVEYMKARITNDEVENITDPEKAYEIVRKGNLTYLQAKHIAKAGTVESILYDSAHGCVVAATAMGISAALGFALNLWNGESFEDALKESIFQGLKAGGLTFIISVLSSQLAKTGLNSALVPASTALAKALGPKVSAVIVNAFRSSGSQIYGAAAMQSAAKLLRGGIITTAVTFVVLTAGDISDIIRGRISWSQLAKNTSTTAVGLAGGLLGYFGGAALGSAVLPGPGTVVGLILAVAAGWGASEGAKAIADLIAEDDADKMIRIIESEFSTIATEYFLNQEEADQAADNLQTLVSAEMLKQMYQYKDHLAFARQLVETAIDPVVAQRQFIYLPSEEEYAAVLSEQLINIYEDIENGTTD